MVTVKQNVQLFTQISVCESITLQWMTESSFADRVPCDRHDATVREGRQLQCVHQKVMGKYKCLCLRTNLHNQQGKPWCDMRTNPGPCALG